jgi:Fe-Mn family superoxide dismutase
MTSTKKSIDVEQIVSSVAEQVRKDFFSNASDELNAEMSTLVHEAFGQVKEAYVPQRKTYSMTTDHLSEETKKDHETLYRKEVETITRVSAELDGADKLDVDNNHSNYRSIKKDEVTNLNAVYLHELYFANCFDPNSELFLDALAYMRLAADWGTFDAWMADFMACAMAARSGWVVCGYSLYLKKMINIFVDGHDQSVLLGVVPVLVVDMWEHAYVRDYGNDKKSYLTAMMREIDWEVIEDRVTRIDAMKKVLG